MEELREKQRLASAKWRKEHPEKVVERRKAFYEANKDKVIGHLMCPITCECGFISARTNLSRHQKSNLHLKRLSLKHPQNDIEQSP
jgi:hypothetical protein